MSVGKLLLVSFFYAFVLATAVAGGIKYLKERLGSILLHIEMTNV